MMLFSRYTFLQNGLKPALSSSEKTFSNSFHSDSYVGLGTHLFVKVPRPGDSEVTFSTNPFKC